MLNHRQERRLATQWTVCATRLPLLRRRCLRCPSTAFRTHGKFRVNANHKLLDVWLLALCAAGCGATVKLTVLERVPVRSVDPSELTGFHSNDPVLAARVLGDPVMVRHNGVTLDWDGAWAVHTAAADLSGADVIDTAVRFALGIPIKVTALLSAGLSVSRSEVHRLTAAGRLTATRRLTGTASGDFGFTLHGWPVIGAPRRDTRRRA